MNKFQKLILKTIIFSLTLPLFFSFIVPFFIIYYLNFFSLNIPIPLNYIGIILIILGIIIYSLSCYYFIFYGEGTPSPLEEPKNLITHGIYKYTRNPMYISGILIVLGLAVFLNSLMILIYCLLLFLIYHSFIVFYEEPHLRKKFGKYYEEYCKNVPRWIRLKLPQRNNNRNYY